MKEVEKRINDLKIKSTVDKEAAKKHGLDYYYVMLHKGSQYKRPAYMVGKSGSYYGWSKHIEKELKRLTDDWLQGEALGVDLDKLACQYQAGEKKFYNAIRLRLESKINYIITQQLGERKAVFTRLDGRSAKSAKRGQVVVPKPGDDEYNKNETQQLDLIFEERFTEAEQKKLVDKSLKDALRTFRPGDKTFKSWFGDTLADDIRNYKDECKSYWKQKPKKSNWQAYIDKHREVGRVWDYSVLYENYPGEYIERLTDDHKRLLNVRAVAGDEGLFDKDEARVMGIKEGKRNKLQDGLEREYIEWMKANNIKVKVVTDNKPGIKSTAKPNLNKKVCKWVGKRIIINPS